MVESVSALTRRDRMAVTGRVEEAPTGSPRPQWQGLFREPDWPPEDDED